jgi:hypothetical protein
MSTHCFETDTLCELASGELELAVLKSVQLRAQFLWEIRSEHTDGVVRRAHGRAATLPKGAKLRRHKERQESQLSRNPPHDDKDAGADRDGELYAGVG